jgi:hypothetical protein
LFVGTLVYFFEKAITGEAHWEYAGSFAIIYTTCEMIGSFYMKEFGINLAKILNNRTKELTP